MGEDDRRRRERSRSPSRRRRRERSQSLTPDHKWTRSSRDRDDHRQLDRHRSRHSSRDRHGSRDRERDRRRRSRDRDYHDRESDSHRRRRSPGAARDRPGDVPYGEGGRGNSGPPLSAYDAGRAAARNRLAEVQAGGYDNRWDGSRPASRYESALASGLDGDLDEGPDSYDPFNAAGADTQRGFATNTVFLKGVPLHKNEVDIRELFHAWPNLIDVRLGRDGDGQSKGFAFLEFTHEDYARALMESPARGRLQFPDAPQPLALEYSRGRPGGSHGAAAGPPGQSLEGGHAGPGMDWLCNMCQATNFGRRLECHQCSAARPANPRRVAIDPDEPSTVLKVSNLQDHVMQETLEVLLSAIAPVQSVRMVADKFTGAPRGFCFAEFATIADAAKVLHTFNNRVVPEAQHQPLRLCYARPQPGGGQQRQAAAAVPEALQAAMAMQAYADWAPKELDEDAIGKEAPQPVAQAAEEAALDGIPSAAATADGAAAVNGAAADNTAAAAASEGAAQQQAAQFEYDPATGYHLDKASGLYYDANSGLYYDSRAQLWLAWDAAAGQYVPAEGQLGASAAAAQPDASALTTGNTYQLDGSAVAADAAPSALPTSTDAYTPLPAGYALAEPAAGPAAATDGGAGPVAVAAGAQKAPGRRRGATIGSAPQLSQQGLQAALRQAEEKERLQRIAAAKQAAAEARKARAAAARAAQQPAAVVGAAAAARQSAGPPAAAGAPPRPGPVQGVVHRGKWAPKPPQA